MHPSLRSLLLSLVLAVSLAAVAGSALAQPFAMGLRPPTPEEEAYLRAHMTEVTAVKSTALAKARALIEETSTGNITAQGAVLPGDALPSAVDNSTLKYFPPIGDQGGQGSCTCWAACYCYSTFTQARDANVNVSGGDNDYISSPAFMYPLVNDGRDEGAWTPHVVARLSDVGCSSWTLKPYDDSDYLSWPSEAAWSQALEWRTQTPHEIIGSTWSGIEAIKQHLANGNVIATHFWVYFNFVAYPSNASGINNRVYYAPQGAFMGGHAVTIVGYDDNRTYVDDRDGETYSGAFLMANSWGPSWGWYNSTGTGSKGFLWVAYRTFLEGDFGPGAWYNDDRPDYRPTLYAVTGINHNQRGRVAYTGGIGLPTSPEFTGPRPIVYDGGNGVAITDAKRVAVDLTDGLEGFDVTVEKACFVSVTVSGQTTARGTITSAAFCHDRDGDGLYGMVLSTDPTVFVPAGSTRYATARVRMEVTCADILWRNSVTGEVAVWLMKGTTIADAGIVATVPLDSGWAIRGVGDFTGDEKQDILWRNTASGEVAIWTMNGRKLTGGTVVATVALEDNWEIKGVGDFNADGYADVLWRKTDTGEVAIWIMKGTAIKSGVVVATVAPEDNWEINGVGDLNGNGHDDIVWRNSDAGDVAVWLVKNGQIARAGTIANADSNWVIKGVADLNADGRENIVWYNASTGDVAFWILKDLRLKDGLVIETVDPGSGLAIAGIGDFNGDGRADVLWREVASGDVILWIMYGMTIAENETVHTVDPDAGWEIKGVGDFDGAK